MPLIERTEYHIYEGEDEYGAALHWLYSEEEAQAKWAEKGYSPETHCIVKVTYYCQEYERIN